MTYVVPSGHEVVDSGGSTVKIPLEIQNNNNIKILRTNMEWLYIGKDLGGVRLEKSMLQADHGNQELIKPLTSFLNRAETNKKLDLNTEELSYLYMLDPHGVRDYLGSTSDPVRSKQVDKLRKEVYTRLSGQKIKYYRHDALGWQEIEETNESKPQQFFNGKIISDADIYLDGNISNRADLMDIVNAGIFTVAVIYTGGRVALVCEAVGIYGIRNTMTLYSSGALGEMVGHYKAITAKETAATFLNPKDIHFMQNSIKNVTGDYTVLGNAEALKVGTLTAGDLSPIRVWKDTSGKVWTLDHRRLAAFKLGGVNGVPVEWVTNDVVKSQMWKMTTNNCGTSVILKLGNGETIIVK